MTQLDLDKLKATLAARSPGPFHFHEIYGRDWETLYIGTKKGGGRLYLWKPHGI